MLPRLRLRACLRNEPRCRTDFVRGIRDRRFDRKRFDAVRGRELRALEEEQVREGMREQRFPVMSITPLRAL